MAITYEFPSGAVLVKGEPPVYSIESEMPATVDAVWGLSAGDRLEPIASFRMSDGPCELMFTRGRRYEVERVLLLRVPAAAIVLDDTGHECHVDATLLVQFKRVAINSVTKGSNDAHERR